MDPNEERHPNSMSAEELEQLRKSDPAAFDDEGNAEAVVGEAGQDDDDTKEADDAGDADGSGGDVQAAGAQAAEEGGDTASQASEGAAGTGDKAKDSAAPDMIPKPRFDEVNNRLKDLEKWRTTLTAAAPPAAREFDSESAALEKRYDDGEIDITEFMREQRKLAVEQAKHEALVTVHQAQVASAMQAAQASWDTQINVWKGQHADFLANPLRAGAVSQLIDTLGADPNISDADLIRMVEEAAFEAFNWKPAGNTDEPATKEDVQPQGRDLHAGRRAASAAASAAASSAPPNLAAGGVGTGNRGGPQGAPDVSTMKPGTFSKTLSKADQEKLLGEGAL